MIFKTLLGRDMNLEEVICPIATLTEPKVIMQLSTITEILWNIRVQRRFSDITLERLNNHEIIMKMVKREKDKIFHKYQ